MCLASRDDGTGYCYLSFILSSFNCRLFNTSGSGSGSTFLGFSRSHLECEHLMQAASSVGADEKMCLHLGHS